MKKYIVLTILVLGLVVAWQRHAIVDAFASWTKTEVPVAQSPDNFLDSNVNVSAVSNTNVEIPTNSETNSETTTSVVPEITPASLPAEVNLDVPFTSQAPHANWDLPYQEACEETAAVMVRRYWTKNPFDSKDDADQAIRKVVDFQESHYGFYKDTTADESARFIRELWGYTNVDVLKGSEVTIDSIKREVANGFPVIVLAAGRELGNPNFTSPGPIYHALVVKGYLKNGTIITNDPGTRKGADYLYDPDVLYNAIHDWNGGDVSNGEKVMIVIRPDA